ncbi:MAG: DNA polymerase III subunit chi [Gammaproteobacteria bacterium]
MPRVDFYLLEEGDARTRGQVLCTLVGKAFANGRRVCILAGSAEQAEQIDDLLWTHKDISFLPHQRWDEHPDPETPILIGWQGECPPAEILVNMSAAAPSGPFERLIEVVDCDPAQREEARGRYRTYRQAGYALETHRLHAAHERSGAP